VAGGNSLQRLAVIAQRLSIALKTVKSPGMPLA
jgi:hypothetical protein